MGLCTKALINQVLCEETVTLTRFDQNVPIGSIPIPRGSNLSGKTIVSLLDCVPMLKDEELGLQISFFIQEELFITTPQGARFPIEFGFRFQDFVGLQNCTTVIGLQEILDELDCRVVSISGRNELTLHDDRTFDQCLELTIELKLLLESQLQIALCPPYYIPCSHNTNNGSDERE